MDKPILDADGLEQIGKRVRDSLVNNYDGSAITTRSGTLRASLAEANIQVEGDSEDATITVAPDNRQRPARQGEANPPSVQEYGPITFDWAAGRLRGFTPTRAVTFGRGVSPGASGTKEILALDTSQAEEVGQDISDLARQAIIARLSR